VPANWGAAVRNEAFNKACYAIYLAGRGAMELKDGSVVSGRLITYELSCDGDPDPGDDDFDINENAFIAFECEDGADRIVNECEFKRLVDPGAKPGD
jgi:hypothetical protein